MTDDRAVDVPAGQVGEVKETLRDAPPPTDDAGPNAAAELLVGITAVMCDTINPDDKLTDREKKEGAEKYSRALDALWPGLEETSTFFLVLSAAAWSTFSIYARLKSRPQKPKHVDAEVVETVEKKPPARPDWQPPKAVPPREVQR